jgi:nitroreductase
MEFFEVLERRRSVRAFEPIEVERHKLATLFAAASAAPSAGDCQAYEIVMVQAPKRKAALAKAALDQEFVAEAPVVLAFVADPGRSATRYGERGASLFSIQDTAIAAAYVQLAATALGLASCWVGAFDEREAAAVLKVPRKMRVVSLMPLGYPAEKPVRPPRRKLEDIVRSEDFA